MVVEHETLAPPRWQATSKAVPDFLIAADFLIVWINPYFLRNIAGWLPGPGIVGAMVFLLFFEFFMVGFYGPVALLAHSKKPTGVKIAGLGFMGLLCLPFVVMSCKAVKGVWPLLEVVLLGWNKWLGGKRSSDHELGTFHIIFRWATMGGLMVAVLFSMIVIPVPKFGTESWMVRESGISMSGEFANKPHQFLAAGVIYFTCLGIYEIIFHRVTTKS